MNELFRIAEEMIDRAEANMPRATRFDPNARSYEAFGLSEHGTRLLESLTATTLKEALAETTGRWSWDRGDRIGIREIGGRKDLLHVYAVRRKSTPNYEYRDYRYHREHERWLDRICTIDLNIIAGIDVIGVSCERDIHEHRQRQRPEGARLHSVTRGETGPAQQAPASNSL